MEKVPLPFRTPARIPNTSCDALPGMETCGWLMLSTTATSCSFAAGTNAMLGSGLNGTRPPRRRTSARLHDELLGAVVDLRGRPRGLDERDVDHDVPAADVPLADHDLQLHVVAVGEALALDALGRGERDLVGAGAEVLRDLHDELRLARLHLADPLRVDEDGEVELRAGRRVLRREEVAAGELARRGLRRSRVGGARRGAVRPVRP